MEAAICAALTAPKDGWTITERTASFTRGLITCEKSATFNIVAVSEALAIARWLRDRETLGLRPLPFGHFETDRTPLFRFRDVYISRLTLLRPCSVQRKTHPWPDFTLSPAAPSTNVSISSATPVIYRGRLGVEGSYFKTSRLLLRQRPLKGFHFVQISSLFFILS